MQPRSGDKNVTSRSERRALRETRRSIGVIICAYTLNRWQELIAAVASVRAQHCRAQELIVVIDSNPALLARAQAVFTDAIVIANNQASGLSGARNSGIAIAKSEIVAFLDDDATADSSWLENLLDPYEDDSVLGVGGAIHPGWEVSRPVWFPEEFGWVVGCSYRGLPERRAEVRNLIGANMSFRREVFDEASSFACDVGQVGSSMLRCDDTEFCIRLRQHRPGGKLLYEPSALVYHWVPESRASVSYFARRCFTEGISKARVGRLVGQSDGLSSERRYASRTLPAGVLRSLGEVVGHGRPAGLARATAIVAGLAMTSVGYWYGSLANLHRPSVSGTRLAPNLQTRVARGSE